MRLHIHSFEGSGNGLCGSFHRPKEPITVTPVEIIYQRRVVVLDHAQRTGNVAEACRFFGISRKTYYPWKGVADWLWPRGFGAQGPMFAPADSTSIGDALSPFGVRGTELYVPAWTKLSSRAEANGSSTERIRPFPV